MPPRHDVPEGMFTVATRRGKQFNSMVLAEKDPLTGAGRDAVYIDRDEAASMGLADGDAVVVRSEFGTMAGHLKTVRLPAPQPPGALARGQRAAADGPRAP